MPEFPAGFNRLHRNHSSRRSDGRALRQPARYLPALVLLLLAPLCAAEEPAPEAPSLPDESWQVIEMGGARVGYAHAATHRRTNADGQEVIVTDTLNHMEINRFNMRLVMTVRQHTEETADGRLLSFRFRLDNPPISQLETSGRIDGETLVLETRANGTSDRTTKSWDPDVKSPAWQDRELQERPLQPGEQRSFRMYDPQFNQVATITLTEKGRAKTRLLDGAEVEVQRIAVTHSLVPGLVVDSYLDESGEIVKTETNLLQTVTYAVDRETALRELDNQPIDLAIETLVKVKPIADAHRRRMIVYRIEVAGGDAARHFPEGPTQQVEAVSDTVVEVTTSAAPSDAAADPAPPDPACLKATRFLDCTDRRVREHAAAAAPADADPRSAAVAMERYVYEQMRDRNFATGLATASEVAEKMEGDCTEHAVLLAAMLRAREIPARVAVGLVYSERHSAFAGHMWTEAFLDGRWVPFDATLGRGGIGAAHIKLADSALDEDAPTPVTAFLPMLHLLGQITIEVVAVE